MLQHKLQAQLATSGACNSLLQCSSCTRHPSMLAGLHQAAALQTTPPDVCAAMPALTMQPPAAAAAVHHVAGSEEAAGEQ
jgi:hypothetical protein